MSRFRAPEPDPAEVIVELCAFRVGDEEYVLDIQRIREIVHPLPVTPVPRAPPWMDGVVDLRGEVLPLIDVRKRLGLPPRTSNRRTKILVVNVAGRLIGLLVDAVSEVVRIPRSSIGPPPALTPASSGARLFLGVVGAGAATPARAGRTAQRGGASHGPDRLRLLLNVKALIDPAATYALPARAAGPEKTRGSP